VVQGLHEILTAHVERMGRFGDPGRPPFAWGSDIDKMDRAVESLLMGCGRRNLTTSIGLRDQPVFAECETRCNGGPSAQ
jgi:hypothetical protein